MVVFPEHPSSFLAIIQASMVSFEKLSSIIVIDQGDKFYGKVVRETLVI